MVDHNGRNDAEHEDALDDAFDAGHGTCSVCGEVVCLSANCYFGCDHVPGQRGRASASPVHADCAADAEPTQVLPPETMEALVYGAPKAS